MRATQLYSVVEGDAILGKSPFVNPFELGQQTMIEEPTSIDQIVPQIHVHITETVHVLSKAGEAEKSVIWGEISLQYDGPTETATPVCFQLAHPLFDKLETTEYVHQLDDQGTFQLQTLLFTTNESRICIKYQVQCDLLPLTVKPMWKCDPEKSRLLIKYHKHADVPRLENVVFVTSVTGNVQNALSIPEGELVLSQKRMMWHIGDIQEESEAVIKAQFVTLEQSSAQPIAVRFEIKDHLLSRISVQQGVDAMVVWAKVLKISKNVKVGKYIAEV